MAPEHDELERLLAEASWLRGLAFCLVGDESRADDLVQETWAASIARPPQPSTAPRSWLRGVARRLAARTHRTEVRRARREWRVARPEAGGGVPEQELVERAELQQRVARVVLDLAEPYRSTVLLRFYEEHTPGEIARREGVPAATVHTRLSRALEILRGRLDAEFGGDRSAWTVLLLPLVASGAAPAVPGVYGAATSTAAAAGTSAAPTTLALFGGLLVTKKILVGVIAVAALGIAFFAGRESARDSGRVSDQQALDDAKTRFADTIAQRAAEYEARAAEWKKQSEKSEAELAGVMARLKAQQQEKAAAEAAPSEAPEDASVLAVDFGDYGSIEALRDTDWTALARALRAIDKDVAQVADLLRAGKAPDREMQLRLAGEGLKLQQFAMSVLGKLPTHTPGAGDYAHPVALANMVAAYLEVGELPLAPEQRDAIAHLGDEYDTQWDEAQARYTDDTLGMEKLLDELVLKDQFSKALYDSLDPKQQADLARESFKNIHQMDAMSPAAMLTQTSTPLTVDRVEDLRERLIGRASSALGVEPDRLRNLQVFDVWMEDVRGILEPTHRNMEHLYSLDTALVAARAQVRAMKSVAQSLQLDAETYKKLAALQTIVVPRVVTSDPPGAAAGD